MLSFRHILLSVTVLLLAACSSVPYAQRQAQRLADYTAAAGAPVSNFRFFTLYSWEPLGDKAVAVYTRPNEAWLLDIGGGCPDLPFTSVLGLTSNLNQVSVRFDHVVTGRTPFPCTITQIRPVNVKQLKAAQQERKQINAQPRTTASPAG